MEKYFLYARKSSEDEDRQIQSIPDQISVMANKAENLGLTITHIFEEEKSAKSPGRVVFNEMIQRLKKGEATGIITWKLDRLSRNPIDSGILQYMLQTNELSQIVTSDRIYNETDAGLLFSVESGIGNQFILDLKKGVKRGLDFKTSQGVFCARVPEGYLNKRDDKTIITDPTKFVLVRKMRDLMLSGNYTALQVLNIINNDLNFRTRITKKQGGKKLSQSGIYRILNNIFYTGDFMWKGQIRKGTHIPMITYEEFYRVQEMLGERGIHIKGKTREFAFTGFIKCGECGCAITAEQKTKEIIGTRKMKDYVYYRCTKRKEGCKNCTQNPIRLEDLEKQIDDILSNIEMIPEFKDWALVELKADFEKDLNEKLVIQKNLQSMIDKAEKKLKNLTEALIGELINEDEYTISKKQIMLDIGIYRDKLNRVNDSKDESIDDTERIFNFVIQARSFFNHGNLQTKKEIFRTLGLDWTLKDGILQYKAFPRFKRIQEFNRSNSNKNYKLELTKNSTNKGIVGAKNSKNSKWYSMVNQVRMSILKYGEKVYLPNFAESNNK